MEMKLIKKGKRERERENIGGLESIGFESLPCPLKAVEFWVSLALGFLNREVEINASSNKVMHVKKRLTHRGYSLHVSSPDHLYLT